MITTIAGTGVAGFFGDGGPATLAKLSAPRGIAIDAAGNIYFSDYSNQRIRKINTSGIITTIAGTGFATYGGDGGPATAAALNFPWGIAVDGSGNVFIADQFNCRVRKINAAGIMSTVTGDGICFISGDGGLASLARVQYPLGVACDGIGDVFIADYGNNRVRKIDPAGIISTIAGSPTYGFSGDGGPSTAAKLYFPEAIAADAIGNIYICDVNNGRIRMINSSGIINTIVGIGTDGFSGDGGLPTLAQINRSTGIAIDALGRIYISDNDNNRIRILHSPTHEPYFTRGHVQDSAFCPTEAIMLDSLLSVFDVDTGQTETWSLAGGPYHGIVVAGYTTLSTGSIIYPLGLSYAPNTGYTGPDSFKVRIFDGTYSDTTTFHIDVLIAPFAGSITGIDSLCPGDTLTFVDTAIGGTWSMGTGSTYASVSSSGLITGIAPGNASVVYSVTNACGTATATFAFVVRSTCPVGVNNISSPAAEKINLFPNPNTGEFTLSLISISQEEVQFTITNIVGEKVKEFKSITNKEHSINLDSAPGIYFVSARSAHGNWMNKIIVGN